MHSLFGSIEKNPTFVDFTVGKFVAYPQGYEVDE